MKLLFDENLSHKLVARLADLYPDSIHVRDKGLKASDDTNVWEYAKMNGFVIVSKDEDFHHLSFVQGAPPKVIGISLGNCTTQAVEILLRQNYSTITAFDNDTETAFLLLR
jgi:predicted nuclease of predicted toxin-antitoxin system